MNNYSRHGSGGTLADVRLNTAMVTPFDDDLNVDYGRAAALAERLVEKGSEGLVVSGTTGESPTLGDDEKEELIRAVVKAVGGRAWVWAGAGTNDTRASIRLSARAAAAGADGLMLVTPYYNKPTQEGLYQHFGQIAAATELPIMLYNVPGRTGSNLLPDTVERLTSYGQIVALKESSGDLGQVSEAVAQLPSLRIYSGDDFLTLPILAVGGVGVVSVASHVVGPQIQAMMEAYFSGQPEQAQMLHQRLFPLFRALFLESNPAPVKAALAMQGFPVGGLRPPLVGLTAETKEVLQKTLAAASA